MIKAREHINSREAGSDQYYLYDVANRNDFINYITVSDEVSVTQTGFKRMTMRQIAELQNRYGVGHVQRKLESMIGSFSGEGEITIDPLGEEFGAMTFGVERSQRYRDMAKLFSLHRLQKEEVFTSPVTATLSPSGVLKIEPGTTRMLFLSRPETVDVMLTDLMGYTAGSTWTRVEDWSLQHYVGLKIGSYAYTERTRKRFDYANPKVFHKELIMDINDVYRIQDIHDAFQFYADDNEARVNGVPLCRRVDGAWEVIPYDRDE